MLFAAHFGVLPARAIDGAATANKPMIVSVMAKVLISILQLNEECVGCTEEVRRDSESLH